jgi:transporter family-2 protein
MYGLFAILGAITVGLAIGFQAPMNAGLGKLTDPRIAALFNFILGGVLILLVNLIFGNIKDLYMIKNVPWYYLLGGVLGFIVVTGSILVVPVLGAGTALSLIVSAQLLAGMLIDHFGLFGVRQIPIDLSRILGLLLLIAGVRLITR